MALPKGDLSTVDMVEAVMPWLPPSETEVRRSDAAAFAAGGLDCAQVLHEFFMLKVALGLEYGLGLLERLGLRPEGLEQYQVFYVRRLAEGLVGRFPGEGEAALGILAVRLKAYGNALRLGLHPEDPHLAVADAFTRFCKAADNNELVCLCLDACRDMHGHFLNSLGDLGFSLEGGT
ncbi:MAG: hypothetical protein ACREKE_01470 [bacterium]